MTIASARISTGKVIVIALESELPGGCRIVDLDVRGDERGNLIAIEGGRTVPFDIQRIYYIFGTRAGVVRGCHAHRSLRQLCIAVSGGVTLDLDDGLRRQEIRLDNPATGLLITPMMWREMRDFTPDCVLIVVADTFYDDSDYLRNYEDFLAEVKRIRAK